MKKCKQPMGSNGEKYHNTARRFKYTVMLCLIIPIILLSTLIISSYSKGLHSELEQRREIAYEQIVDDIKDRFVDIQRLYVQIGQSQDIKLFLTSDDTSYEFPEKWREINDTKGEVLDIFRCSDHINNLEIYSISSDNTISVNSMSYQGESERNWYIRYKEHGELEDIFFKDNYITMTKPLSLYGHKVGLMAVMYNVTQLKEDLNIGRYGCDIAVKLTSQNGEEVFKVGEVNPIRTKEAEIKVCNSTLQFEIGDKDEKTISRSVLIYSIVCILSCLTLAYIISTLCAKYLYKSVTKVYSKIGTVDEQSVDNASKSLYNEGAEKKDMEQNIAEMLDKLQTTQLTALQMQINPHFVFNVLNYVNVEILRDDKSNEKAAKIISLLSSVLDYAMSEPKYSAQLAEEIEMTKRYIEIEKIELGTDFDVVWDIDKSILGASCIKLFLQPIVENSIMHGVKKLGGRKGRIEIVARPLDEGVCITVTDNGNGIEPEKLKEVRKKLAKTYDDYSKHIGLRNVNERIKMVYGKNYGVSIDSDRNGTKVTIRIGGGGSSIKRLCR